MPTVVIDATGNLDAINNAFQYLAHLEPPFLAVDLAAILDGLSGLKNERSVRTQKGRGNRAERGPVNGAAALS